MKNIKIFPVKLWNIINNKNFEAAIHWSDDGKSFYIDSNKLKCLCLGKTNAHFHTEQPKSFIRQLHLYGFRKIDKHQFQHKFFQRDRPDLINHIHRKYNTNTGSKNFTSIKLEHPSDEKAKESEKFTNLDKSQRVEVDSTVNQIDSCDTEYKISVATSTISNLTLQSNEIDVPSSMEKYQESGHMNRYHFEAIGPVQILDRIDSNYAEFRHCGGYWMDASSINIDQNYYGCENILNLYNNDIFLSNEDITL